MNENRWNDSSNHSENMQNPFSPLPSFSNKHFSISFIDSFILQTPINKLTDSLLPSFTPPSPFPSIPVFPAPSSPFSSHPPLPIHHSLPFFPLHASSSPLRTSPSNTRTPRRTCTRQTAETSPRTPTPRPRCLRTPSPPPSSPFPRL